MLAECCLVKADDVFTTIQHNPDRTGYWASFCCATLLKRVYWRYTWTVD